MSGASTPAISVQVAIDCADPHALARFWAQAFGFEIEDHHPEIVKLLELGYAQESDTVDIDGRKAWATAAGCLHRSGSLPRLLFQKVPESKQAKNRVHLDVHVAAEDLDATTERVLAAGAKRLWDGQQGPHSWTTYADPEGNEFCLAQAGPAE